MKAIYMVAEVRITLLNQHMDCVRPYELDIQMARRTPGLISYRDNSLVKKGPYYQSARTGAGADTGTGAGAGAGAGRA